MPDSGPLFTAGLIFSVLAFAVAVGLVAAEKLRKWQPPRLGITASLVGGFGRDFLTGNSGFDTFDFNDVFESPPSAPDVVVDFVGNGNLAGDVFDFSSIDANALLFGNQGFTFIGGAAFTAQGNRLNRMR
jgi:hypothetical protein